MSVKVDYIAQCKVKETLEANVPAASLATITHALFDTYANLSDATDIVVTQCAIFTVECETTENIDLTNLTGTNNLTVDATDERVIFFRIIADPDNQEPMSIEEAASNGYPLKGEGWYQELRPGQEDLWFSNNEGYDVTSSTKNITVSGEGALHLLFVFGPGSYG